MTIKLRTIYNLVKINIHVFKYLKEKEGHRYTTSKLIFTKCEIKNLYISIIMYLVCNVGKFI